MIRKLSLLVLLVSHALVLSAGPVEKTMEKIPPHPRLILTETRLDELKTKVKADPYLQRYVRDVLTVADSMVGFPLLKYEKPDGKRLLHISREAKSIICTLAFAYRWSDDQRYLRRAVAELENVCAFKDWNPSHFLDVGEMTFAVAIGYDWLYAALSPAQKTAIESAIRRHALNQKPGWWLTNAQNWNAVCNGGLAVGALTVMDLDTPLAAKIIERARVNMPKSIKSYAPDGFWCEGMCYWEYMSEYTIYTIASMKTALDTDFGLSDVVGFNRAPNFPIHATSPLKHLSRFGDFPADIPPGGRGVIPDWRIVASTDKIGYMNINAETTLKSPSFWHLFWFAHRFDMPSWAAYQNKLLETEPANVWDAVFYHPERQLKDLPRSSRFRGPAEMILMRTSHTDPLAGWLSVKAGANSTPHGQIDAGHFEFEIDGVRWAYDLGRDDYNLPGYFSSKRWNYYRSQPNSHSLMSFDNQFSTLKGKVTVAEYLPETLSTVLDMRPAYDKTVPLRSYLRTFQLRDTGLIVRDVFELEKIVPCHWQMVTDAKIELQADGGALLKCKGKTLKATIVSPKGLCFSIGDCARNPPEITNKGFRMLQVDFTPSNVKTNLEIILESTP